MALHLIPSHATIKSIKPGDKRRRLTDGAGLRLQAISLSGSRASCFSPW
jgi:hypothetical protein